MLTNMEATSSTSDERLQETDDCSATTEATNEKEPSQQPPSIRIKNVWLRFLLETSLHGCKHILNRRHGKCSSLAWIGFVAVMGIGLGFVLVLLFMAYRQYPFKTVYSVRPTSRVTLPALTFCLERDINMEALNDSPVLSDYISKLYNSFDFEYFFESDDEMNEYRNSTRKAVGELSMSDFNEKYTFKRKNVMLQMNYNYISVDDKDIPAWIHSNPGRGEACWTLNWNASQARTMTAFDIIHLFIDVQSDRLPPDALYSGLKLYVHEQHSSHALQNPYALKSGTYQEVLFTVTEHKYLPLPYQSFGGEGCMDIDSDDFRNPLKYWDKYSKASCVIERMLDHVVAQCDCVSPDYGHIFPNATECTFFKNIHCFNPLAVRFLGHAQSNLYSGLGCLQECSYTTFDLTVSTAGFPTKQLMPFLKAKRFCHTLEEGRENLIMLVIKSKTQSLNVIEHVPEMTLLSIFGTVGGYMGLFLGASLLTLTEVFESLFLSLSMLSCRAKFGNP